MGSSGNLPILRDFFLFLSACLVRLLRFARDFTLSMADFGTPQFVSGLLWCLFCAWWNSLSQIYVDKMHWAHFAEGNNKPLQDIGFILLPRINISHLPDVWNAIIVVGTLLPVVVFHPDRVKILRRFAAIQGTCFLLRSVTILVTILPNPYDTCANSSSDQEIPFIEAFKVMLGMRVTCGDVLYSGHAANFTLMAFVWQEYGHSYIHRSRTVLDQSVVHEDDNHINHSEEYSPEWYTSIFFPRLFWGIALVGYMIIIACRFHYTVDVVVAIVVVAKQWGLYHMVIRTPKLLDRFPLLQWYESKKIYSLVQKHQHHDDYDDDEISQRSGESENMHFEATPGGSPSEIDRKGVVSLGIPLEEFDLEEGFKEKD